MIIKWTQDLSVGVKKIDNQHKELFKRINKMIYTMTQNNAKHEIMKIIKYLENYVTNHFGMEEEYMSMHEYPGSQSHVAKHKEFNEIYNDFKKAFEGNKYKTDHLAMKTQGWLCGWWVNHIASMDKDLAAFLKTRL
jgi:hemerythrin